MVFMQSIDSAGEVKSYLQKKYALTGLNCLSWKVKVSGFSFFEGFDSSGKVFVKWGGKSNNCRNDYDFTRKLYSLSPEYFFQPKFFECEGDVSCFAMEYLEFKTLKELILKKALSDTDKAGILEQLVEIGEILITAGVVHRDIKPDNVAVLKNGRIKLFDFEYATDARNYKEREEFLRHPDLISCVGTKTECGYALGPGRFKWDDMFSFAQVVRSIGYCEFCKDEYDRALGFFSSRIGQMEIHFPNRLKLLFRRRLLKILAVIMPFRSWRHNVRMLYRKPLY